MERRSHPSPAGRSPPPGVAAPEERRQQAVFVLRLHWVIIALSPLLTVLSGRQTMPGVWVVLGLFALCTLAVQASIRRRPVETLWSKLGYAVLGADLFLVSFLVWARGGLVTDFYHFYYLVIVGASILFGVRESLGFALAAGVLYGMAVWLKTPEVAVLSRVAIRTIYFILVGTGAAYLAAQVQRHRLGLADTRKLLSELREAHAQLKGFAREMSLRAVTDGQTGLYDHTYFHQRLDEELRRAERYDRPLSLLMLDLDDFKVHNDVDGHPSGDRVLAEVARILAASVRKADVVCRYGGDEFTVIMPETEIGAAVAAAERIRRAVERRALGTAKGKEKTVTVSIGVASRPDHADTGIGLVEASDQALYASKRRGKNRVTTLGDTREEGDPDTYQGLPTGDTSPR